MSSCIVHIILVRFESNLNSVHRFWKNSQISNFVKSHPMEAKFFHLDRQK